MTVTHSYINYSNNDYINAHEFRSNSKQVHVRLYQYKYKELNNM